MPKIKLNFTLSEFNISGQPIPQEVADAILEHHILPMQVVRNILDAPIYVSEKSGYRSPAWEKKRGRSGNSQHTYKDNPVEGGIQKGKGATDWTADDLDRLEELIIAHTPYTRIARYENFIHCDYKPTAGGKRQYFRQGKSGWEFVKHLPPHQIPH